MARRKKRRTSKVSRKVFTSRGRNRIGYRM